VRLDAAHPAENGAALGIAARQFRHQVIPLVRELTARHGDRAGGLRPANSPDVEAIAASQRLITNAA
jgi:hypothetical protein